MRSELFVSLAAGESCAALREDGRTVEFRAEVAGPPSRVGSIIKGRVSHVAPSLQAAFVEVGHERDAFLHARDLRLPGELHKVRWDQSRDEAARTLPPIQDRVKPGRELLVQIVREAPGSKGDRATCLIGLPGRYLVLLPDWPQLAVSRRIPDEPERERLLAALRDLGMREHGFVVRTAAEGVPAETLHAEARAAVDRWRSIQASAVSGAVPSTIHEELPLYLRLLRDLPREGVERVELDDVEAHARAVRFAQEQSLPWLSSLRLYQGSRSLFVERGLDRDLKQALSRRVRLPSGVELVIDEAEAMVCIDVNSGRSKGSGAPAESILETNLEAAAAVAHELRLRDLGGIVVIDFIDMESEDDRRQLKEAMESVLQRDPARTKVVDLSELGLLQMTRKRTRRSLSSELLQPCAVCDGKGHGVRGSLVDSLASD